MRSNDGLADTVELPDTISESAAAKACDGVDVVIHLAAAVHLMGKASSIPRNAYYETNVAFSCRLAEAAHKAGARRFVFVSTIKTCGEASLGRPLRETDEQKPADPYAYSKWIAEQQLRALSARTGLEMVIVRPPLVYGPGVKANFLALMSAARRGLPLPFLNLTNKRSLIYVDNLTSALIACASHSLAAGETFHVSDPIGVTLPELVTELARALGKKPRLFPIPEGLLRFASKAFGRGEQIDRLTNDLEVDPSKICGTLAWAPPYSFQQGIQATAQWYVTRRSRRPAKEADTGGPVKVCQLCAVDFTLQHLLLPLVDGMRANGWSVMSVCSEGPYVGKLRELGYSVHTVPISRNIFHLYSHMRAIWGIYRICRAEHFDVLHVHTPVAALLGRIAGRMAGVPAIIYTAHGFYFHDEMTKLKYRFFVQLEKWSGRLTDYLFTQSEEDAETAIAEGILPPSRISAIGNGVNVELFKADIARRTATRAEIQVPQDALVIGVVARLVREKGLIEFLEAAAILGERFPHLYFLLVGERLPSDYDASIETELERARGVLGHRLLAVGYRQDVAKMLGAMDVFCLPSYREGMPRSIIEAMMMGLPVVATNIRGAREEVVVGETGLLVPTRDVASLTAALETLVRDPEAAARMGAAGQRRALDLYDESRVIARQISTMSKILPKERIGSQLLAHAAGVD